MTLPLAGLVLPRRLGVNPSCVALSPGPWATLLSFLAERFHRIPAQEWQARMERGDVLDAQGKALRPDQAYVPHSRVYYYRQPPPERPIPFEAQVLYQDAHLLVADKPHFLPVLPSGRYLQETLLVRLQRQLNLPDLAPLHRIDRDTAGLVLFSVQRASRGAYAALFRERQVHKTYEAVAPWRADLALPLCYQSRVGLGESFMTMRELPGPPNAQTELMLLERKGGLARYRLSPITGRRHQLRVHMMALGVPILNDAIYPVLSPECPLDVAPDYSQPLQLLAQGLQFRDPVSAELRTFTSQRVLAW
jgi:tRNA pseudouridine32 synthase/23S rRNA pseudouridine746 synthase